MAGQPAFLRLVSLFPVSRGLMGSLIRPQAAKVQDKNSKGLVLKSKIVSFKRALLKSRGIKPRSFKNHKGYRAYGRSCPRRMSVRERGPEPGYQQPGSGRVVNYEL